MDWKYNWKGKVRTAHSYFNVTVKRSLWAQKQRLEFLTLKYMLSCYSHDVNQFYVANDHIQMFLWRCSLTRFYATPRTLTTHNIHMIQKSMPPAGFEPTIANKRAFSVLLLSSHGH